MLYNRGPRVRNVPKNHALSRLQQKKLKNNDENYLLSQEHLKSCFEHLRTTAGHAPGPDGLTYKSLNDETLRIKLGYLSSRIRKHTYQPGPTRDIKLLKEDGSFRIIKIPNIMDRVASRAALNALSPVLEPTFEDWSYGYRPKRSYRDIFANIKNDYANGCRYIAKLDICKAFDNVNKRKLRTLISKLSLNSKLRNLVEAIASKGLTEENEENLLGLIQGDSLSGLLFNFYLHEFHDKLITDNLNKHLRLYRYADDFIYLGNNINDVRSLMDKTIELLTNIGMFSKSSQTIDIESEKITVLGLTVGKIQPNIIISLSDLAFNKLIHKLDEALTDPFPTSTQIQIVRGWTGATSVVTLMSEERSKLVNILDDYEINIEHLNVY